MPHDNKELDRDAATPLYVQIKETLQQGIEQGHFVEGKLLPSIRQLASEFGVAVFTVRQALDLMENEGIISRQSGRGAVVVGGAKPLPQTKLKRSAILFLAAEGNPEWEQFSFPIKHQMEYTFDQAAFRVLYGPVHPELLEGFLDENVDDAAGIILWAHYDRVKEYLPRYGLPVVLFGEDPKAVDREFVKDVVNFDGYDAITSLVSHLLELGHTKMATIHGPSDDFAANRRLKAYTDTLTSAGIPVDPDYVAAGHYMISDGREAMRQLLAVDDRPTAVVCHNDYMALGAIAEIQSVGLRIPEDISVTGLDDIEASAHLHPPLTTAKIDRELLGGTIARLMVERLANPRKPFTAVNMEATLQIRKSCRKPGRVVDLAKT